MIRLFTKTPELLLPRQFVHFEGEFPSDKKGKYFMVEVTQQITYRKFIVLQPGTKSKFDLSDDTVGLLPQNPLTLYEILMGIKGEGIMAYAIIPEGQYYYRLEETDLYPDVNDVNKRYIGAFEEVDTPYEEPRLRIHTVKDMQPLVFEFYNDNTETVKASLRFIVNRVKLKEVPATEVKRAGAWRDIQGYDMVRW